MERLAREGGAGTFDLVFVDGDKARLVRDESDKARLLRDESTASPQCGDAVRRRPRSAVFVDGDKARRTMKRHGHEKQSKACS